MNICCKCDHAQTTFCGLTAKQVLDLKSEVETLRRMAHVYEQSHNLRRAELLDLVKFVLDLHPCTLVEQAMTHALAIQKGLDESQA